VKRPGLDVNKRTDCTDGDFNTAAVIATAYGRTECVRILSTLEYYVEWNLGDPLSIKLY